MSINKVDIGYFEFLKEKFNADLIVTGITVSIFAVIVFFNILFKCRKNKIIFIFYTLFYSYTSISIWCYYLWFNNELFTCQR